MEIDVFSAFWTGTLVGLVVGISISGILAAVANSIDRGEKQ